MVGSRPRIPSRLSSWLIRGWPHSARILAFQSDNEVDDRRAEPRSSAGRGAPPAAREADRPVLDCRERRRQRVALKGKVPAGQQAGEQVAARSLTGTSFGRPASEKSRRSRTSSRAFRATFSR